MVCHVILRPCIIIRINNLSCSPPKLLKVLTPLLIILYLLALPYIPLYCKNYLGYPFLKSYQFTTNCNTTRYANLSSYKPVKPPQAAGALWSVIVTLNSPFMMNVHTCVYSLVHCNPAWSGVTIQLLLSSVLIQMFSQK